jgi:hypothetical protein
LEVVNDRGLPRDCSQIKACITFGATVGTVIEATPNARAATSVARSAVHSWDN